MELLIFITSTNYYSYIDIFFALEFFVCVAAQLEILMYLEYTPVTSFSRRLAKNSIAVTVFKQIFKILSNKNLLNQLMK
ncbi:hypothetical protein A1D18_05325 [Candidatus Rickettsiella isopodorum]|uniref:Uncharacterized protein n=1 Tax=Candidatus Rickettsiella isopodorum TaxID=1225476 RepID=A0A1J8NJN5_9COXI|nr:hypothetical protein A1D18_05325 [Candidatus Rickettsiella isopodorum]